MQIKANVTAGIDNAILLVFNQIDDAIGRPVV